MRKLIQPAQFLVIELGLFISVVAAPVSESAALRLDEFQLTL